MEVLVAKKIKEKLSDNLVVALVDERYGPVGHPDSNWFKLEIAGFKIKGAKMIPILIGISLAVFFIVKYLITGLMSGIFSF